jgi:hypothetical protein
MTDLVPAIVAVAASLIGLTTAAVRARQLRKTVEVTLRGLPPGTREVDMQIIAVRGASVRLRTTGGKRSKNGA